MEGDLEQFMVL